MAEAVLGIIAGKAAQLAASQIIKESSRLSRVREDLVWIETEMRFIQSYLKDVEATQLRRKEVQSTFIREIWDLAYDVEDIIDTYFPKMRFSRSRWKRLLDFTNMRIARGFVKEVEGIRKRVEEIKNTRQTFGIDESSRSREEDTWDPRQSFPHLDEPNVVGFDNLIKILVPKVLDEDLHHRVVSIIGFAGLGKTTLARKVYNSARQSKVYNSSRQHFDCAAWICVSESPNEKKLLGDIARQVGLEKEKIEHDVETNLFEFLSTKRYVIVIDDIWSLLTKICNLRQLTYLKLRSPGMTTIELPFAISNLKSLLTLDLREVWKVYLPNVFWSMKQLRHILLPNRCYAPSFCRVNLDVFHPVEISLPNLQTLHGLPGEIFKADWLHKITSFRRLLVNNVNKDIIGVLSDAAPVSHKLEELYLFGTLLDAASLNLARYDNLFEMYIKFIRLNDLSHDKLPPNLIKLNLFGTFLTTSPTEALKKLQKLKFLELSSYSFLGKELVFSGEPGCFPQLEVLEIHYLGYLERVVVEEGGLPRLRDFMIRDCSSSLETLVPDRVRNAMRILNY